MRLSTRIPEATVAVDYKIVCMWKTVHIFMQTLQGPKGEEWQMTFTLKGF